MIKRQMFNDRKQYVFSHMCLCLLILLLHSHGAVALHLYSDTDLGSGDYNNDELNQQQYSANTLQRSNGNGSQSQGDIRKKLQADINEFIDLIPADEVAAKIVEFYRNDYDVHRVIDYLNSEEFSMLEAQLVVSKEYIDVDNMLSDLGVNFKAIRRRLDELLGFSKLRKGQIDEKSSKYNHEPSDTSKYFLFPTILITQSDTLFNAV